MDRPWVILLVIAMMAAVALLPLLVLWLSWRRRPQQMVALAHHLGLDYARSGYDQARRIPQFRGSWVAPERNAYDVVHGPRLMGEVVCEVVLGDCTPFGRRARGRTRTIYEFGVPSFIAVRLPGGLPTRDLPLPRVVLRRAAGLARMGAHLSLWSRVRTARLHRLRAQENGLQRFTSKSVDFDSRFTVLTEDLRFASNLLDPLMMEHLLQNPPPEPIVMHDGWIVAAGTQRPWSEGNFLHMLNWLERFVARIPAFMIEDCEQRGQVMLEEERRENRRRIRERAQAQGKETR